MRRALLISLSLFLALVGRMKVTFEMINLRFFLLIFCGFFFIFLGCSNNGIEGNVRFYGTNKPAPNIQIRAITRTDIKEEQSKAVKTTITDSNGRYKLTGLLPDRTYEINSNTNKFMSNGAIYGTAPAEGTKVLDTGILVCPIPPKSGVWVYPDNLESPMEVNFIENKKVKVQVHEGLIGGGFGNTSAFSVSDRDINSISSIIHGNGLLVIFDYSINSIGRLHKIIGKKVKHPNGNTETKITDGWYYNISDFYYQPFMIAYLLAARHDGPNFKDSFKNGALTAIPLSNFTPGVYIFVTSTARGQRATQLLGGESHPKEGFLVKFDGSPPLRPSAAPEPKAAERTPVEYYTEGLEYLKNGKLDQSIETFTNAINFNPKYYNAVLKRAEAYQRKGQEVYASSGNFNDLIIYHKKVIADLTTCINIQPTNSFLYVQRGGSYNKIGDMEQAFLDLNKAIELDPKQAYNYYSRAMAYESKRDYSQAIHDYSTAINIDPNDGVAIRARALAHWQKGDFDSAWQDVHHAETLGFKLPPETLEKLRKSSGRER